MGNIVQRGNEYYESLEYQNALELYNDAIASNPNNALTYLKKANCLFNLNRPNEAIAVYNQCLKIDPNYQSALYNIGVVYYSLSKTNEALSQFENCISLITQSSKLNMKSYNPNNVVLPEDVLYNKAMCLYNLNRKQDDIQDSLN